MPEQPSQAILRQIWIKCNYRTCPLKRAINPQINRCSSDKHCPKKTGGDVWKAHWTKFWTDPFISNHWPRHWRSDAHRLSAWCCQSAAHAACTQRTQNIALLILGNICGAALAEPIGFPIETIIGSKHPLFRCSTFARRTKAKKPKRSQCWNL